MIDIITPFPVNIGSSGRAGAGGGAYLIEVLPVAGGNRGGAVLAADVDDKMPVIVDVQSVVQQHQDHPDYSQFSIDNVK